MHVLRSLAPVVLGVVGAMPSAAQGCVTESLFPERRLPLPPEPLKSMQFADLDQDGIKDLVMDGVPGVINVMLGLGQGTFGPVQQSYVTNYYELSDLVVQDLNQDTIPDIIVDWGGYGVPLSGAVSVLLGIGDGTFGPPLLVLGGQTAYAIAADDVDGDLLVDLVAVDREANTVLAATGNGDGTFGTPVAYRLAEKPFDVDIGDVNGDGLLDLVALQDSPNADDIVVLLGDGAGNFDLPVISRTGASVTSIALGDLDNDGFDDVCGTVTGSGLVVLESLGNAGFQQPVTIGLPKSFDLELVDVNGDSTLDIVVCNPNEDALMTLHGDGDAGFGPPIFAGVGNRPFNVALDDLNGDGYLEALTYNNDSYDLSLLFGNPDGTFALSVPTNDQPFDVQSADLDGDGNEDLVVIDTGVSVLLGTGGGTFSAPTAIATANKPRALAVGELNGDGVPDVALVATPGGVGLVDVLFGQGDGTFIAAAIDSVACGNSITIADLNSDSLGDLIVSDSCGVSVLLGAGGGAFAPPTAYPSISANRSSVADVNADGAPDLLTMGPGNNVSVYLGIGDGRWGAGTTVAPPSNAVVAFDQDGDGHVDLGISQGGAVQFLLGDGLGGFTSGPSFSTNSTAARLKRADVDADGIPDLIASYTKTRSFSVLVGAADGSFAPPVTFGGVQDSGKFALADFDGNGMPDLVSTGVSSPGTLSLSLNQCVSGPVLPSVYCTASLSHDGCIAAISTSDLSVSPVSGSGTYSVTVSGVAGNKNGLLFAGDSGAVTIPFNGATLCVQPPLKRGPLQPSGGTLGGCDGAYATLVDDGVVLPAGLDAGSGGTGWYQYWYRDPQSPFGSQLSNAIELTFF